MIKFQQTIQRNYTANVKELIEMFNSFHLSSDPQKLWYNLPAKQWVIADNQDVHCISVSWKHCRLASQVWKYIQTFPRLTWDKQKNILVASFDDGACDHINTLLNEPMLCWCIELQWSYATPTYTIYSMIISMNMCQLLSFSLCHLCWASTLFYKVWWCCWRYWVKCQGYTIF